MNNYLNDSLSLSGGSNMTYNLSIGMAVMCFLVALVAYIYYYIILKPKLDPMTGKETPKNVYILYTAFVFTFFFIISVIGIFVTMPAKKPASADDGLAM